MCGSSSFSDCFIFLRFHKFLVTHVPKIPCKGGLAQHSSALKITLASEKCNDKTVNTETKDSILHYYIPMF